MKFPRIRKERQNLELNVSLKRKSSFYYINGGVGACNSKIEYTIAFAASVPV